MLGHRLQCQLLGAKSEGCSDHKIIWAKELSDIQSSLNDGKLDFVTIPFSVLCDSSSLCDENLESLGMRSDVSLTVFHIFFGFQLLRSQ